MTIITSFLLVVVSLMSSTAADSFDYLTDCTDSPSYDANSTYQTNLHTLLASLPSQASNSGFYNSSSTGVDPNNNRVYALYLCRGDLDGRLCNECVYQAQVHILKDCPNKQWSIIWYDECMLWFNNTPVFRTMALAPSKVALNPQNETQDPAQYSNMVNETISGLVEAVANTDSKFGTVSNTDGKSKTTIYVAEQCTPDLSKKECGDCLATAVSRISPLSALGGRVLQPSCYVRFETTLWYGPGNFSEFLLNATNNFASFTGEKGKPSHKSLYIALGVTVPIVVAALLLSAFYYSFSSQKTRQSVHQALNNVTVEMHDEISNINAESLQFEFRTIRIATNNFSEDNKLGQGGFGAVYKGILQNGQEIAVKRLSTNSKQGNPEFKTEVYLVARLQHRNLVRLLGFCLHKDEKLLIYEFLPNSSLDKVLLDRSTNVSLDWETRYKIIGGVAKGLLYLHEDSRLKVIHRDMKSSNILLDESMNAKIADFGLARLVGADQSQLDTNKAFGTYGYMAPEYIKTGRLSIKSDVYSFGVVVLEIISGHKCNSTTFPYHEESLVEQAWRLWSDNNPLHMVDLRLGSNFSSKEVEKCIHIALLCIQEDANKRPTMAPIVSAINGHHVDLPSPITPQPVTSADHSSSLSSNTYSGSREIVTDINDPR